MNLILCGMPGCGKTHIGNIISDIMYTNHIDVDYEICKKYNMPINDIFLKYGETYFREVESSMINYILQQKTQSVISLGGGSLINKKNIILCKNFGILIFINTQIHVIIDNINQSKDNRPLIKSNSYGFISNLLIDRLPSYIKSDVIINSKIFNNNPEMIAREAINQYYKNLFKLYSS